MYAQLWFGSISNNVDVLKRFAAAAKACFTLSVPFLARVRGTRHITNLGSADKHFHITQLR